MYLCFYTYPKTKVEQSQSNYDFFLSLDCQEVNNRFFFAMLAVAQLLHGCFLSYPNTTSEQSKCNGISFYPEVARKSITRSFSSNKLLDIVVSLFLYLPKDKSRTITM